MWILLSLGTALFAGTSDALAKKALQTEETMAVAWVRSAWGSLFLAPLILLSPPPSDPRAFWSSIAFALPLEVIAAVALQSALKISPISMCIPFLAFTPVFLVATGWIALGERVSATGVAGVLLVTAGALLLQLRGAGELSERRRLAGPLLVLLVAFLYSVTSVFARRALEASSPLRFSGTYYLVIALAFLPLRLRHARELFRRPRLFAGIGLAEAAAFVLQFHAFLLAPIAYMLAVKRLSLLVSVMYGRVLFGERHIPVRAAGAAVMVTGAALIAFA